MDLYLKTGEKYRQATPSEICEAASAHIMGMTSKDRPQLKAPGDTKRFLRYQGGLEHEQFGMVMVDTQRRVIKTEILFRGSVATTSVHPREVVRHILNEGAASVVFFHNHPSGNPEPSGPDEEITRMLCQACALFDVRVFDHLIVAGDQIISFAEKGLL